DTFDMKPEAPSEYRGPYQSIASSLPGLDVGELMPEHARIMDKCTVVRSFSHGNGDHWAAAHWMLTGRLGANGSSRAPRYPSMGAVASHLLGPRQSGALASVNINDGGFGYHGASWLGVAHNPFRYGEYSYGNEAGRLPTGDHKSFSLVDGLNSDRLMNRLSLQNQFDKMRSGIDTSGTFENMDSINQQALDIITSGRVREAFHIEKEDQKTRDLYGPGWGEQALLARRLVEAGVRYVSLNTGYWDDHSNIQGALDNKLPRHDRAVGALIQDLAQRGMLENTLVVSAGEFGRTPKINVRYGRDHWGTAWSIALGGCGIQPGAIIGKTNEKGTAVAEREVDAGHLFHTYLQALGIDSTKDHEIIGRSVPIGDPSTAPIKELLA
ncbi:MAG: DUF1501 domain-containing protein, partial [Planctomycetaceae bacterium]|nr:DUF1501 domain-containing protein [Planctomycetaceae bacterium]